MKHRHANSAPVARSQTRARQSAAAEPDFFSLQIANATRFYLDAPHPPGRLAVVCGGHELCRPEYHVSRSTFPYYSIEFVAAGQGLLKISGKEHKLVPGDVFAYGPGIAQDIRTDPDNPLTKYFVDFVGTAALGLLQAGPAPGAIVQTSAPDDLRRLFDDVIAAGLRRTPFSTRISAIAMEHLLLRLAETAVSPGSIGTLAFGTYQTCRRYIEQHYLQLHSLAQLAEICHVDSAYICRLFSRFDHESPYQYLMRLKMLDAARRLQEPGALVKQVAAELNFEDPFRFSRTFRRVLGVSPRRFAQLRGFQTT